MIARISSWRAGLGLCAIAAMGACQSTTGPDRVAVALANAEQPAPLAVAVAVSENSAEGLMVNDWGGEVPQSKPVGEVDEGGLADLR